MDWIDKIEQERKCNIRSPLLQSEHETVNTRYPGCTLEYCSECGEPTGRAGRGDDSIFAEAINGSKEYGPLCTNCRDDLEAHGLIVPE